LPRKPKSDRNHRLQFKYRREYGREKENRVGKATAKKKTTATAKKKAVAKKPVSKKKAASKTVTSSTDETSSIKAAPKAPAKKVAAKKTAAKKATAKKAPVKRKAVSGNKGEFKTFEPYHLTKGEEYMNEDQTEHFRSILQNWKVSLMEEVDRTVGHMKSDESLALSCVHAIANAN